MKLALGTAQFGFDYGITNQAGRVPFAEVAKILDRARDAGITLLDTAIAYGESEAVLGRVGSADFRVITKLPGLLEGHKDVRGWVRRAVDGSLCRLRRERLDALLLHRHTDALGENASDLVGALMELRGEGYIGALGVSVYDPSDLTSLPRELLQVIQAPVNVLDRRFEVSPLVSELVASGTELHARSAMLQGLLAVDPETIPPSLSDLKGPIGRFQAWAASGNKSVVHAAIGHAMASPLVRQVVVGVTSVAELVQASALTSSDCFAAPAELMVTDRRLTDPSWWTV